MVRHLNPFSRFNEPKTDKDFTVKVSKSEPPVDAESETPDETESESKSRVPKD